MKIIAAGAYGLRCVSCKQAIHMGEMVCRVGVWNGWSRYAHQGACYDGNIQRKTAHAMTRRDASELPYSPFR